MRRSWIKLWCDQWVRGSIRKESSELRGIFADLLAMAGDSAFGDEGIIQLAEGIGFSDETLAGILNIPLNLWLPAKQRLSNHPDPSENRIEIRPLSQGFSIKILNWQRYQSEYQRQKTYRKGKKASHKKDCPLTLSLERKDIRTEGDIEGEQIVTKVTKEVTNKVTNKVTKEEIEKVLSYFNEITGQNRSSSCKETKKFIQGRLSEGRTFEDFKHVIDTKTVQWRNDPEMSRFLRPSTLFRQGKFEDYLNEPYQDPKRIQTPKPGETRPEDRSPIPYSLWLEVSSILGKEQKFTEFDLMRFHSKAKIIFPEIKPKWDASSRTAREFIELVSNHAD